MKILSINTANKQSDLAIYVDGKLFEKKMSAMEKHSESAMVGIHELFKSANQKVANLDAMAVVVGPGSFTGIRIGISLALGFSTAFDGLKLIEITAFEFLKEQFLHDNTDNNSDFICVFNALSGKYFVQSFDKGGNAISKPETVEGVSFLKENMAVVGLNEENLEFARFKLTLTPKVLNKIAVKKFKNNEFSQSLIPLYLRKSQAEDMLEKKEKQNDEQ